MAVVPAFDVTSRSIIWTRIMLRTQSQKDHVLDREIPHRLQSLYALTSVAAVRAKKFR
jgi:hypothetical protein